MKYTLIFQGKTITGLNKGLLADWIAYLNYKKVSYKVTRS